MSVEEKAREGDFLLVALTQGPPALTHRAAEEPSFGEGRPGDGWHLGEWNCTLQS